MAFSMDIWRKIYDEVHVLGSQLKIKQYELMEAEERQKEDPIKHAITWKQRKQFEGYIEEKEEKIGLLLYKCKRYFKSLGMTTPKPLWIYDIDDKTTWASHKKFKYNHLLKKSHLSKIKRAK